jgi:hypothetical protein
MSFSVGFISRCNDQKSSTFCSANADQTQVIGSFRRESIRFTTQPSAVIAGLIWQQYPTGAHHLMTRRRPTAGVAFSGKF